MNHECEKFQLKKDDKIIPSHGSSGLEHAHIHCKRSHI